MTSNMDLSHQLWLLLISLAANVFSAFSGGGAGLIQLPALLFLGLPFGTALATHKAASVALGMGATLRHAKERQLFLRYSVLMLGSGLPGVMLGTRIILSVPERAAEFALGVLTAGLGVYSILRPALGQTQVLRNEHAYGYAIGSLGLFLIGVLNGSLTSGTGLFATLWLIRWFGMDYRRATAHRLVLVGLFWNGLGAAALGVAASIEWSWLPALLIGSLVGGYLGAHFSISKGNRWIKRGYEITTLAVGAKLMWG